MSDVPERESLTVELKSDVKKLPDRELVLAGAKYMSATITDMGVTKYMARRTLLGSGTGE